MLFFKEGSPGCYRLGYLIFVTVIVVVSTSDLFASDGVLVLPPRDARIVSANWRVIVTLHPPKMLPLSAWVGTIRKNIANYPTLSDASTRVWWIVRLRRLDGLITRHGRGKRAILGFIGKLSKIIFGTATEADVEDVNRILNIISNQEQDLVHNVEELWTMVNGTREYVQQNRIMLFSLAKHTSQLRELINWTVECDRQLTVHLRSLRFTLQFFLTLEQLFVKVDGS